MRAPAMIGDVALDGREPAVIVPLMSPDGSALALDAERAAAAGADIVEWRLDAFRPDLPDAGAHAAQVLADARHLRARLVLSQREPGSPAPSILATFRTADEGGERRIAPSDYARLLTELARTGGVDAVDIEPSRLGPESQGLVAALKETGVAVVASHHRFDATPEPEELRAVLERLLGSGADLVKLAVMPRCPHDVVALMSTGLRFAEAHPSTPVIALAMGELGRATRVLPELAGSVATFATAGAASAPGQIRVEALRELRERLAGPSGPAEHA